MKKILLLIMFLIPFKVDAMSASSMVAVDLDNDYIYFDVNKDDKRLIASITKIMTAIVTIENIDIDKEITVGKEVLKAYGSAIYINVGEKITIRDLLYGLIMRSGNDAAVVLAQNVAGSMEGFVHLMNELASNIGMKNSNFVNAHGLEENDGSANYSTAYDMALITKYAMNNKTFREIFGTKKHIAKSSDKTYSWINKNKLLCNEDYITGGKTGFTKKARRTLVTTASRNNINVVVVTLNDSNDFFDHKNMYEEIFAGLTEDPKQHIKLFDEVSNDEMVIVKDIPFYSMCEHHLLPFFGMAHIGYIPSDNKIIGLSKLARIVNNFAKKPQVQERLTSDIADFLNDNLQPKGVAVIMEAEHMCITMRGVKSAGSKTQTSALRGIMRTDAKTRAEVLSLLK